MMKESSILNKNNLIITFCIWLVLNALSITSVAFNQSMAKIGIVYKILLFPFIHIFVSNISRMIKNKNKIELIITITFICIGLLFLILTYPGTWSWDDIFILREAKNYNLSAWQFIFSGLFHILCLEILPFNSGIQIIQILTAGLIVGYSISSLSENIKKCKKKSKKIIVAMLTLITLFPPLIEYLLSGYRIGIYSYIELLLIVKYIELLNKNKDMNIDNLVLIVIISVISAVWRTEGIYYVILTPLILLLSKKINMKKIILCTLIIIFSSLSLVKINNKLIGNNNYSITATISPITEIIKIQDTKDKKEIAKIEKVLDISRIYNEPDLDGETQYWNGIVKGGYTDSEYSKYIKAYITLSLRHPSIFINTVTGNFFRSSGIIVKNGYTTMRSAVTNSDNGSLALFDQNYKQAQEWSLIDSPINSSINENLRTKTIRFIACIKENGTVNILYYFFWNLLIPIALVVVSLILNIMNKKLGDILISLSLIGRTILVCVTASAPYFMYYLSIYLIGYIYGIYSIVSFIENKKERK